MHFGDERETARNCPHCHALSRMSPTALPTFDELLLQKPRIDRPGAALSRLQCARVPALRHARLRQQSRRAVAAGLRRRTAHREIRVQLRAGRRGDLLSRGADLLFAQSVPGVRVDVPAHRAATAFVDLGNSTKLRLFDSLSDVREMAEIDEETFAVVMRIIFAGQRRSAARPALHQHLPGGGVAGGDEGLPLPGVRAQGTPAARDEGAQVLRRGASRSASRGTEDKRGQIYFSLLVPPRPTCAQPTHAARSRTCGTSRSTRPRHPDARNSARSGTSAPGAAWSA